MEENIVIFGAHSDDEILGMGGTILKYALEGNNVYTIILSYGEGASPWLRKQALVKDRIKETQEVSNFLGSKESIILGLPDGKLQEYITKPIVKKKIKELIRKYNPTKIFVTSSLDPHFDHRAVNTIVLEILEEIDKKKKISVFTYEVWNVITEHKPRLYIDITPHFKKKIQALKMFESQRHYIYPLLIPVYYRSLISGLHHGCRYAERFYKVR